ncbi:TPA: hypothetical protein QEM39_000896 [Pseudomonas putida]|uniref:hypothetical protein n=1 Tax=Pseudomonas TaxID=286 RepID=UPI000A5D6A1B|nr:MULTISPECIES: hypothetical protein [Pseudomonas]MDD2152663.1 hypothetical protein [Pseudomonas putida]HDS1679408.1 hypothetical protein [Pseudomonas putida]
MRGCPGPERGRRGQSHAEPFPVTAQPLRYYQLWHARKHRAQSSKWLRGLVLTAAKAIT